MKHKRGYHEKQIFSRNWPIMIAAAVFLMICNVREERKAGETAENMVIQMESLEAELPERLTSESEELVPE